MILVAQQLTPSDTIRMDFAHIAGILCADGSRTSHSAILARSMGIPAIVGCAKLMERVKDGEPLLIDGSSGEAVLWPGGGNDCRFFRQAKYTFRAEAGT